LNVLLPRRSFPTSDPTQKNGVDTGSTLFMQQFRRNPFWLIDVGYFDGSIDDLGAAYHCAALAVLMANTMTKWKRAAMATTMTTMLWAFVGLLRQRHVIVGGIHMTTQSRCAGWCRIPNGIDEVVAH
jgi:hypothetical protein